MIASRTDVLERIRIGWPHYDGRCDSFRFTFRLHRLAVSSAPVTAFTHALRWATQHAHHGGAARSVAVHPAHAGRPRHYALPSCDPAATSTCNSQRTEMRATQRRIALPPSRYTCSRTSPSRALKTTPVRPLTSRPWTQTVGRRHRRIRAADASGTTYTLASRECTDEPRCASASSRASARSHHLSPSHASPLLHDPCFPQRARAASVVTPHHLRACPALLRPSLPTPRCRRHS